MADASGGSTQSGHSAAPGGTTPAFSWNGGSTPSTIDPKQFGTKLLGDLSAAYSKGPQSTIPSYNPFTAQTSGLIQQGLDANTANQSGVLKDYASGANLGGGNPYLNDYIKQTNNDVGTAVNSAFNSSGLYGSDVHAKGLAEGIGNADNAARFGQYNTDFSQMLQAQNQLGSSTAQALGYSGLLDSKNAEKIASDQAQQQQGDPMNYIAKYLGLLNGNSGQNSANTNQPVSLWNILGGVGSVLGSFL